LKIVEIGCGKGHFLGMLRDNGFNVIGFDPAYEESDKSIVKDYFGKNYYGLNADLVVLRHTIEHVNRPMDFIQTIAKSCGYKGKILIETPDFRWVVEHSVFWDICYEHCNYFTPDSIGGMFEQYEYANLFGGQYMYILADLSSMRDRAVNTHEILTFDSQKFTSSIEEFRSSVSNKSDLVVWGAGTKGVLLANITDPNREHIEYLVDINPDKQGRYIPGSGHHVVSPEEIKQKNSGEILVLNKNYKGEIEKFLSGTDCRII
jgi:SAM-dependent methyltransferase